jgi:ubiquinone/menaquinone biosynthesis C-methylase UbiE
MHVLDLGCGPAPLGLAIAERLQGQGRIDGLDLSARQLEYARRRAKVATVPFAFHRGSMDDLPFEDCAFDAVVTSLALHELPPSMRRTTLDEVARVLKRGGIFALVDWSKPRLGLVGLMWLPLLLLRPDEDHWHNAYPDLCRARGLTLKKDVYLNSLVRCQVFEKDAEPANV